MLQGKKVKIQAGMDFDPIPMDKYTTQITDVNLVSQMNYNKTAEEDVLEYKFTILDDKSMIVEKDGKKVKSQLRGRRLIRRVTPVIGRNSWLKKLTDAVFGRPLTPEEISGFDAESIVGKQVDVMTEQSPSKDGTRVFTNIISFGTTSTPLPEWEDEEAPTTTTTPVAEATKSVPAKAPAPVETADDPDEFVKGLEEDAKAEAKADEEDDEVAKLEKQLAEAKAKKAGK